MKYHKFISRLNRRTKENGCEKCTYEVTDAVVKTLAEVILEILLEDEEDKILIPKFIKFNTRDAQIRPLPNGEMVDEHKKIEVTFSELFQREFMKKWKENNNMKDEDN
ncbi:hypothetical protein [Clostridium sp.]|uniref:hypothetical protein n=1 Tax=Clostridium sp. TaxID=1506 RepID=UPI003F415301